MKNLRNLILLLVGIVTISMSFTSCNTDSEDYSVPEETTRMLMTQMAGTYGGKMRLFYVNPNATSQKDYTVKYDSLNTSWDVYVDSTMTVHNFPVNKLDSAINVGTGAVSAEATTLRAMQKAISEIKEPVDLKCYYWWPTKDFIQSNTTQGTSVSFYVNPVYFKQTISYEGQSHDVYFVFQTNYYGGTWTSNSRLVEFNMNLKSVSIDKVPTDFTNSIDTHYFRELFITCYAK